MKVSSINKHYVYLNITVAFIASFVISDISFSLLLELIKGFSESMADAFIMFEQWLVHSIFVLVIFAVYTRNINSNLFLLALVLGYILNNQYVLTHHFHYFLQNNRLYPSFFYSPVGTVNVQYGLIMPYFIFLMVLFCMILIKTTRTLSRSIIFVLATVAWVTTFVFHIVFVQISLMETVESIQDQRQELAEIISEIEKYKDFSKECVDYDFLCLSATNNELYSLDEYSSFENRIQNFINTKHAKYSSLEFLERTISNNSKINLLSKDVSGNQYTLYISNGSSRLIIDKMDYNPIIWKHKIYFSVYVTLAHLVWLFGAYYMISFHRKRFRRLAKQ